MKKIIAIAALLFATAFSATAAPTVTFEGTHVRGQSNAVAIVPSVDAFGLTFDARLKAARSEDGLNTSSGEVRVEKDFPVATGLTGFIRVGAGREYRTDLVTTKEYIVPTLSFHYVAHPQSFTSTFYSVEPGIKFAVTPDVAVKLSDRYTSAIRDNVRFGSTHEFGLEADYAVTKADAVGVKYIQTHGGVKSKGVQLSYIRSF